MTWIPLALILSAPGCAAPAAAPPEDSHSLPALDAEVADALRGELTRRLGIQVLVDVPLRAVRATAHAEVIVAAGDEGRLVGWFAAY